MKPMHHHIRHDIGAYAALRNHKFIRPRHAKGRIVEIDTYFQRVKTVETYISEGVAGAPTRVEESNIIHERAEVREAAHTIMITPLIKDILCTRPRSLLLAPTPLIRMRSHATQGHEWRTGLSVDVCMLRV